ncbi:hypothetical protein AtEden1_Chr5g0112801 [Arabidopsis thaliana]
MTIELIALLLLHPEWSTQVESGGPQLHQLWRLDTKELSREWCLRAF